MNTAIAFSIGLVIGILICIAIILKQIQIGIKELVLNKILEMRKEDYYDNKNYKEKLGKKCGKWKGGIKGKNLNYWLIVILNSTIY